MNKLPNNIYRFIWHFITPYEWHFLILLLLEMTWPLEITIRP